MSRNETSLTDISNLLLLPSDPYRQSEFPAADRCRRKHHLQYTRGLVPITEATERRMPASGQRDAGSAVHAGLEVVHNGGEYADAEAAITAYVNEVRSIRLEGELPPLTKADDPEWWKIERLAIAMLAHYDDWLSETGFDAGFETLAVEWEWDLEIPGTNGLRAYGKVDLVGHDQVAGGVVVDDNKSVANFSQTPMPVDFQLRTYAWAWWRSTGDAPVRAGHRMLKRVLGTGNAKPPFVMYAPVHLDEDILEKHEQILAVRALDIQRLREYGSNIEHPALYPNPTKDCSWDCDFKLVCPMVDEGTDWEDVLDRHFTVKADNE